MDLAALMDKPLKPDKTGYNDPIVLSPSCFSSLLFFYFLLLFFFNLPSSLNGLLNTARNLSPVPSHSNTDEN